MTLSLKDCSRGVRVKAIIVLMSKLIRLKPNRVRSRTVVRATTLPSSTRSGALSPGARTKCHWCQRMMRILKSSTGRHRRSSSKLHTEETTVITNLLINLERKYGVLLDKYNKKRIVKGEGYSLVSDIVDNPDGDGVTSAH